MTDPIKAKRTIWFERNSKKTIIFSILFFSGLVDGLAGFFLIPPDDNAFRCPHPFYHHDLLPNRKAIAKWGGVEYPMVTNSLGFRDGTARTIVLKTSRKRILFLGDSFTEGLGVPYEDSFVGILEKKLKPSDIEILNAAVVSYSPKLYYLKTQYLLEQRGLEFDSVWVFIDISDIRDEIAYEQFESSPFPMLTKLRFDVKRYFKQTSFFYYALTKIFQPPKDSHLQELQADGLFPCLANLAPELRQNENFRKTEGIWTIDPTIYHQFGEKGLKLAADNMQKLVNLCKPRNIALTIAVYPWPAQIFQRDLESIQVKFWRKFAEDHGLMFLNLFPEFINNLRPDVVYGKYFIYGDVHWNASGHGLVAAKVLEYLLKNGIN